MAKRKSKQSKGASKKAKTSNPGTEEVVGEELRSERESICEMANGSSEQRGAEAKKAKNRNPAKKEVVVEELSSERESSSGSEHEEMTASSKEGGPNPPLEFFFDSRQYTTRCKIQTRCHVYNTVKFFRQAEYATELKWFESHPQFCHIFHMPQERSRKLMGLWMLILRTVVTEEKTMKWFVVNGTPIRYSLREHALISGLDCNEYPTNMNKLGSKRFEEKHFKKVKVITCEKVKAKLSKMSESKERLKMAVLYFLCTVIRGLSKADGPIDPFILRLVDDLEVCKEFPWGRLTFDDTVKEINHVNSLMKGTANPTYTFPGFIIPLEFLAFECIPKLTKAFRKPVNHEEGCPRMCHWQFTGKGMRGYPLEDVYHAVGDTKEIQSILVPTLEEELMMARIISEDPDDEFGEGISSIWNEYLSIQQKKIWWEELYNEDLANREFPEKTEAVEVEEESVPNVEALKEIEQRITLMVQSENQELKMRLESMENEFLKMKKTQRYLKKKIKKLENEQMKEKAPLNSFDGSKEQIDDDWGGGSYEPKECEENDVDDVKESGEKEEEEIEEEEKKDEEEDDDKGEEEEKDEEVVGEKAEEEEKDEEVEVEEKDEELEVEEKYEEVEVEEKDEELEVEEKDEEVEDEEKDGEKAEEEEKDEKEDDVTVLTNRNIKERLKDPSDTLRKRKKMPSSKLNLWRLNNLSKKDQTFNEPLFIGFSDVLRSVFEKDYVASKPHLAIYDETFPAPVSNFKIRSLIPDDADPVSAVQQTEEEEGEKAVPFVEEEEGEKVYDPNSWALVPFVEEEEGEKAVPFVEEEEGEKVYDSNSWALVPFVGEEEGEKAVPFVEEEEGEKVEDPPKKKRGRPRKTETKSKPKLKTKTPKPKRKCTKSQWVQDPFTEGKTPEIAEGARKKKKN